MKKVAILLHCDNFEGWYEKVFGLTKTSYLKSYRNDFSWDYAAGLQENGIEVIIYVLSLNYSELHETKDNFKVRFIQLKSWYKVIGKLRFFKSSPIGTYFQELITTLAFINPLQFYLQEDEISLLYVQEYWTTRFDVLTKRISLSLIGADHGGYDTLAIKSNKIKSFPKAYKLTCQTLEETEKVKSLGGDALYIPNGVDTEFYYPTLPNYQSTDTTIFTVARLTDKQKRTSDLIRALAYLDPIWTLEIAGMGPDLKFLQDLALQLKVLERVRFLGFIKDKIEIREKYRQCGVFALPSAWEGLPLAVLEAMSCQAAVVTSDIRAFNNMVIDKKTGIRIPVGEPSALAQGIINCYENRELYGREARKIVVDSFSKKKIFLQLAKIINDCPMK